MALAAARMHLAPSPQLSWPNLEEERPPAANHPQQLEDTHHACRSSHTIHRDFAMVNNKYMYKELQRSTYFKAPELPTVPSFGLARFNLPVCFGLSINLMLFLVRQVAGRRENEADGRASEFDQL